MFQHLITLLKPSVEDRTPKNPFNMRPVIPHVTDYPANPEAVKHQSVSPERPKRDQNQLLPDIHKNQIYLTTNRYT